MLAEHFPGMADNRNVAVSGERINLAQEDRNREMTEFQVEPGNMELEFAYASDWNF